MSSIIKKYNKQNGITYVYESVSYWDKDKQQPRSKRKLIGKLDDVTGEIIPTSGRGRKSSKESLSSKQKNELLLPDMDTDQALPVPAIDADYKALYGECRKQMLEKDALIAHQEGIISKLSQERTQLCEQMEDLQNQIKKLLRQLQH